MEVNQTHEKIISVLKEKGPSLPINMSKELDMSSLFISAFLSELSNEKRIKMSHLKVGGSPLYFLDGQEEQLENYYKFMHPKEAEAFLLLKDKKVLKDADQEPSIRVALRSIRDFAIGFKIVEDIYWRYILVTDAEVEELLNPRKKEVKEENKKEAIKIVDGKKTSNEFKNPLANQEEKKKKQKPKSEFVLKVVDFINKNGLKIIEEIDYKAKEYNCVVQIRSELGTMDFLTQAKDKKTISETDLKKLLSESQSIPLPAFIIYVGDISKKGKDYLNKYRSILKAKRVD